jgi:hypothetical protein
VSEPFLAEIRIFPYNFAPRGWAFADGQLLPIATYMADARAQELPLLTVGDSEDVIHDWFYLFSHAGLLQHDTQIAGLFRFIGWLGMFATVAWFSWRSWQKA